ncbi:GroES chaperonin family [uncultured Caudovirales phage]|uniref:GroES chaperonin family n=1 Tax=uncultured Caudovirales phage TaxID=2100421 RepID=A0A6J5L5S9_9CAUD|nr:GroES chaperonin family [uncultured Caudovirales phage]
MFTPHKVESIRALNDHVLVADMNFGARTTSSGIYLLDDDMRTAGVRPRWARVYAVGPEQQDIAVGKWVLVSHGRWTRGVKIEDQTGEVTIRRIDPNDVLLISDDQPSDDTVSDAILKDKADRW